MPIIEKTQRLWSLNDYPAVARSLPFATYMLILAIGMALEGAKDLDLRWLYPVKIGCVAVILVGLRKHYDELTGFASISVRQWLLAIFFGLGVFALWINLDNGVWILGHSAGFNPQNPQTTEVNALLASSRILGASLVVPVMEELFWRSFVLRWIKAVDFRNVVPRRSGGVALLLSSIVFGLEHTQWAAGIIAGLMYAGLYMRTGRLWVAIIAHAVTNLMLGIWVLAGAHWEFW